ncbi:enoyl-CoA hydratase/isomerase family protein [Lysobacter solisilvae (ex Woo and Kim 2020)]|uniref:Enoyl-CoA hydratase/isomerase family protein n=1 Tax=Agrilutibacter terrestris TaxID=2865112 RepID=A0A7H0FW77_9GAMM|nr:enoyl-CoA hydratase/isomerase family protein [Lysobacter terrestris]QNP40293.1 enoyl-CoA hydratase/isomerase family protein [Lysobacter terrestris]
MAIETIRHDDDILELRLARAPVNALDPDLCRALQGAIGDAVAQGAKGLVLSGNAKVFSAGLDVPYLLSLGDDRAALLAGWGAFFDAIRALADSPVPVVAALTGHAPAGGCVLALCCDYRVMAKADDPARPFRIGLNETQVGLVAPTGIQQLMERAVGKHRAGVLLATGDLVDAERALAIGLVDELVAADQVVARSVAWLRSLLKLPRQPVLTTRAISRADLVAALAPQNIQLERFIDAWTDPDTQAGLKALVARLGK